MRLLSWQRIVDRMDPPTSHRSPATTPRPKLGTLEALRRMREIITPDEARKMREFLKELDELEELDD